MGKKKRDLLPFLIISSLLKKKKKFEKQKLKPPKINIKIFCSDPFNDNLCSQCAKKRKEQKEQEEINKKKKEEEEKKKKEELENKIEVKQTDFTRCWTCNRKNGTVEFFCDCGYNFCGKHRYPGEHNCPINYKKKERLDLNKDLDYLNNKFR